MDVTMRWFLFTIYDLASSDFGQAKMRNCLNFAWYFRNASDFGHWSAARYVEVLKNENKRYLSEGFPSPHAEFLAEVDARIGIDRLLKR